MNLHTMNHSCFPLWFWGGGSNGEYSGQKCLFMPQPGNLRILHSALFLAAFFAFRQVIE